MNPSIELHIEELVLNGLPGGDAQRFSQALQGQLTLLLRQQGLPSGLTRAVELPGLRVGTIDLGRHRGGESLGREVAGSVYSGFRNLNRGHHE